MDEVYSYDDVPVAHATPLFPPRADAIVTMLTSDDFLPGAQTLLYSVKKLLPREVTYPPELVVLVTPNVSQETREVLHPAYCTRIIQIDPISFPAKSIENSQVTASHVKSWSSQGALTKLHIFRLDQYDVILYIDADCVVVKDVSHLISLGKIYQESEALVAAAPDIMPPDKFNAGVLVVRPSRQVFQNMMDQRSLLTTYDGGDSGFLNAYFSEWYTDMPPSARLKFGYNAQRFLYQCTYEKQPNYWDLGVSPELHIVHYSSLPKPWDVKPVAVKESATGQAHLEDKEDVQTLAKVSKVAELDALWWKWYKKSKNYANTFAREQAKAKDKEEKAILSAKAKAIPPVLPTNPKDLDKLVRARFRELRREGKDIKTSMAMARSEYRLRDDIDASKQVAAMFGLSGLT